MTEVTGAVHLLAGYFMGYTTDVWVGETFYALWHTVNYVFFQYWWSSIPGLNIYIGWYHLIYLLGTICGYNLREWVSGHGPLLHWKNSIKTNIIVVLSALAGILPVWGYLRLPDGWQIPALFVGVVLIKFLGYILWRMLVSERNKHEKDMAASRKDMPGDFIGEKLMGDGVHNDLVFYSEGDVFISFSTCGYGTLVIILGQLLRYTSIFGTFYDLWIQLALVGVLALLIGGLYFCYKYHDGSPKWEKKPHIMNWYVNGRK